MAWNLDEGMNHKGDSSVEGGKGNPPVDQDALAASDSEDGEAADDSEDHIHTAVEVRRDALEVGSALPLDTGNLKMMHHRRSRLVDLNCCFSYWTSLVWTS